MATLRHIALPSWPNAPYPKFPRYAFAEALMARLQREILDWRLLSPLTRGAPPPPTLLSFTPAPIYTFGRRQREQLPAGREASLLTAPLRVCSSSSSSAAAFFEPQFAHAPRGGLATYHGPGQVVLWPVVDLRSPQHANLRVREYAGLLEQTTIAALRGAAGAWHTDPDNPGVWAGGGDWADAERKVAALGVYLRRSVTGLGIAVNYSTPVAGAPAENPWARIVPCGIEGRGVTSVREEERRRRRRTAKKWWQSYQVDEDRKGKKGEQEEGEGEVGDEVAMKRLADVWAKEFAKRLGAKGGVEAKRLDEVACVSGCEDDGSYAEACEYADLIEARRPANDHRV
ncbi:hypothetical protein F4809DRAFT_666702 [Biscogniauxia mediterranea]|nr:hypothetical protein F4809DRAFT_666702 [Biscogniauxia mediterranea]